MPDPQTNFDKMEQLMLEAPIEELSGLLEHARLVVRIRSMQPAKRAYVKKQKPEEKGAES